MQGLQFLTSENSLLVVLAYLTPRCGTRSYLQKLFRSFVGEKVIPVRSWRYILL